MKEKTGNRIIQIILLVIIAAGFGLTAYILNSSGGAGGGMPGGMPGAGSPAGMAGGRPSGAGAEQTAIAVEAERAVRGDVSQYIRVNGDVVSDASVDIYPDVSGKLVEKRVRVGDYVKKGDVIAVVDPSVPGAVYSKSSIVSTISGTVTDVNVSVGDTVGTSSSIAVIGDLSNLSVVTYVPERFITYLKTGLNAQLSLEAFPDTVFRARVMQLSPVVDADSRSLEIKLEILNFDTRIRAGMFASIMLVTRESRDCISVPSTAVSEYYNQDVVYVLKDDGTVERRSVVIGLDSEERVEIKEGLDEGDAVVTQGASSITDGAAVRVVNEMSGSPEE